ncbi:MAG: hypothetical protein ABFE01_06280 [Phycisphaerales bacterium]|jgi:hypothetical protein
MSARDDQIINRQGTPLGMLARLWWMFSGNMLLVLSLLFIVKSRGGFFHPADWVFWIAVVSLVFVRYLDIKFLDGCTATGAYASMTHWTRYAAMLVIFAIVAWGLAHAANHLLVVRAA